MTLTSTFLLIPVIWFTTSIVFKFIYLVIHNKGVIPAWLMLAAATFWAFFLWSL